MFVYGLSGSEFKSECSPNLTKHGNLNGYSNGYFNFFFSFVTICMQKSTKNPAKNNSNRNNKNKTKQIHIWILAENNIKNESSIKNRFILSQMHIYFRLFSTSPNPSNNLEVFPEVLPIFGHLWTTTTRLI